MKHNAAVIGLDIARLWSRTTFSVTGASTLTGTKVRDDFADATASLSLRRQR